MSLPCISVIVCTRNRSALLRRALDALHEQCTSASAEIIVVDNGSGDDTPEVLRRCAAAWRADVLLRCIAEPVVGLSRARNAGIAVARGDILAFLDDDAVPRPGWLAAIAKHFAARSESVAAGGPIEPEFAAPRPAWLGPGVAGYYSILDLGRAAIEFPRRVLPFGANMAVRRAALGDVRFAEHLGRVGDSLASGEEYALLARLRAQRGKIFYLPAMGVRHRIPAERLCTRWLFARARAEGVSLAAAARRPGNKARLLVRTLTDDGYWRLRQALGAGGDAVLLAARRAQYAGVYGALFPPLNRARAPSSALAEADHGG